MAVKIGRCSIPNLSRIANIDMKKVFNPIDEEIYSGDSITLDEIDSDIVE